MAKTSTGEEEHRGATQAVKQGIETRKHVLKSNRAHRASGNMREVLAFGAASLGALVLTGILSLASADISQPYLDTIATEPADFFQPFFGDIPPLLAVGVIVVIGAASLGFLVSRGWFTILPERGLKQGLVIAAIAGTLLSIAAILVEASGLIRFDDDLNVPLPWSLLFYPAVAYVVEILLHVLPLALLLAPLALLLAALGPRTKARSADRLLWTCIVIVAFLEPLLQLSQVEGNAASSGTEAWLFGHVLAANLAQLYLFRRYGFVSMLMFRLAYYAWWHVLWGELRLIWLF